MFIQLSDKSRSMKECSGQLISCSRQLLKRESCSYERLSMTALSPPSRPVPAPKPSAASTASRRAASESFARGLATARFRPNRGCSGNWRTGNHERRRAGPRPRPRPRLPEPPRAPLPRRELRLDGTRAGRRAPLCLLDSRPGAAGRSRRSTAAAKPRPRPFERLADADQRPPGRLDGDDRIDCSIPPRSPALAPAGAAAGRHGLGGGPPWRALCQRVRLGLALRGAGRAHRRRLRRSLRRRPRGVLDRRARRRPWLHLPGAGAPRRGPAPVEGWRSFACSPRARGARTGRRPPAGRRVRALRPRRGYRHMVLWTNSVLDAARGSTPGRAGRWTRASRTRASAAPSSAKGGSSRWLEGRPESSSRAVRCTASRRRHERPDHAAAAADLVAADARERHHGDTEMVSRRVEGGIHRYTYAEPRRARGAGQRAGAARRRRRRPGRHAGLERHRHLELYYAVSGIGRRAAHAQPAPASRADRLHRQPRRGPAAVLRPDLRAAGRGDRAARADGQAMSS